MITPDGWTVHKPHPAIAVVEVPEWRHYFDLVHEVLASMRQMVFRGQRKSEWLLESSLDRLAKKSQRDLGKSEMQEHLTRFRDAVRGRRGANPPRLDDDHLWALGQHYGLATPLLDWTTSPFVAAYFAFVGDGNTKNDSRAVFCLNREMVEQRCLSLNAEDERLVFFSPESDENSRLLGQNGLFVKIPPKTDIESWVRTYFPDAKSAVLYKVILPEANRGLSLRDLNRMNINHLSLFPDLSGASEFCNLDFHLKGY